MRVETNFSYTYDTKKRIQPAVSINWTLYPNFKEDEFKCSATNECKMEPKFLESMQILRRHFGRPLKISSGYRDAKFHPIESKQPQPGVHSWGLAADVLLSHGLAYDLLNMALSLKIFTGIGIKQNGPVGGRFIHLDIATADNYGNYIKKDIVRPTVWSY